MSRKSVFAALLVLWLASPAFGQATSEAKGRVTDSEGQPVEGVTVIFKGGVPPNPEYREKSDKKGNYWLPNLLYYPPGRWLVSVDAPGWGSAKVKVVSRAADRTLVAEFNGKHVIGGTPIEIRISGLGSAQVDFVLSKTPEAPLAAAPSAAPVEEDPMAVAARMVEQGNLEGSVEFFKKGIEAKPEDPERREYFAKVLYKLDRLGESEVQAAKAAALAPQRPGPNLILAQIYKDKGDNDKAWAALVKERSLAPTDVRVLGRIASLAVEMGKPDEAISATEAIVKEHPDDAEAWVVLGGLYADKGQLDRSEQAFRKVVDLDPANAAQTFYNIGVVISNKPDLTDAENRRVVEALRKAVDLKPDYAAAHRELAFALLRGGDAATARKELERYLELSPNATDAAQIQATIKGLKK
jgi:tetratricopeptide (TPR) repeat protein